MQPRWLAEAVNPRCLEARGRRVCGHSHVSVCASCTCLGVELRRVGVAPPLAPPAPPLYFNLSLCGLCVCARCTETVRTVVKP